MKLHYQRLAIEARKAWVLEDEKHGLSEASDLSNDQRIFVGSGMLRVQPSDFLGALENETLANMERDGLRDTQFVKSKPEDRQRAEQLGWKDKLLDFTIPQTSPTRTYEAVLDSLAGFVRCSNACAYYQKIAADKGVEFYFGPETGAVESLVKSNSGVDPGKERVTGIKSKDGKLHHTDVVVVAGKL
jgi:sarcosine oxidase / L-pipecolate oxidase